MRPTRRRALLAWLGLPWLTVGLFSCTGGAGDPTAGSAPQLARAGTGLTVSSTVPDSAPRNTTLDVRVKGSGFEPGARATWELQGDTSFAVTRIRTNSTTFVSSSEVRANITIEADAPLASYDVAVTLAGGRKGVGVEKFKVVYDITTYSLPLSLSMQLDAGGRIAGMAQDKKTRQLRPALWVPGVPLGTNGIVTILDQSSGRAEVHGFNRSGQVTGTLYLEGFGYRPVIWDNGTHVLPLPSGISSAWALSISEALPDGHRVVAGSSGKGDPLVWRVSGQGASLTILGVEILPGNASEADGVSPDGSIIVGGAPATRWTWTGAGWSSSALQPLPGHTSAHAVMVNNSGTAVGQSRGNTNVAVVWPAGSSVPIALPGASYIAWTVNEAHYVGGSGAVWVPAGPGSYSAIAVNGEVRDLSEPRVESGRIVFDAVTVYGRLLRIRLP